MTQALEAKLTADTSGFNASIAQAANLTDQQMKKIAQYVTSATTATSNMARAAQGSASSVSGAYQTIAANADHVRTAHAGVNRELLVLTHELSQGNFSRFGGSMLVLAERTNALEYAMTATGAATLGVVGIIAGFAAEAAMGAIEANKFAKSLQLTGNYAALTLTSLDELAKAQAKQTGQSVGGARSTIEAAAGSGAFGPASIAAASRAMGDYEKITGEASDAVLGKFKSIQDGVAKWAEEQNKQMHFLTLGEYDHIKSLEETGQKEQAAIETLNLMAQTLESRATPAVGALAATWNFLKQSVQDAGQAMANVGKPSTMADHIADVQRQIQWNQSGNAGGSYEARQRALIPLQSELAGLMQEQFRNMEHLADASNKAAAAQAGIAGQNAAEDWIERGKALSTYNQVLEKYRADVQAAADGGHALSPADVAIGAAEIKKQFTDHAATAQADEYRNLQARIKAFNQTTEEELDHLRKLSDGQKLVIQTQETLTTSGAKLSAQQQANALSAAKAAATLRDEADASLALKKSMSDDAEKTFKETAAAFLAQEKAIESFKRAGTTKVSDIDFQTSLLGKSPEDAAKAQAMHAIDIEANQKLEAASGQRLNEILAEQAKQRDEVTAAMARQEERQKALAADFSHGWDQAMQDFVKTTSDNAASAKKIFDDLANSMTNAITQFAMTGKLSVKSMVDSIIQDLIRMEVQKGIATLLSKLSSATSGGLSLGSLLPGGGGDGGSSLYTGAGNTGSGFANAGAGDYSSAGLAKAFGHANGLDYVPYDGYPAILHEGERVSSRQDAAIERNGSGGATVHIDQRGMSFGAGVDASGVAQAVKKGMAQTKAEIQRSLSTNGRFSS